MSPGQQTRFISHPNVEAGSTSSVTSIRDDILEALYAGVRRVHRHSSPKESVYIGTAGACQTLSRPKFSC